jgi:hypothetical protein
LQIGGWHAIVCEPAFRKITEENWESYSD